MTTRRTPVVPVVGITMVRDEADIIGATVRQMLTQVDGVIVADNGSTDQTLDVLDAVRREHPGRILVVDDPDPAYEQSRKMTALARRAHDLYDTEWIVPFDADEWWYSPFGRIADVLTEIAPQWLVASAAIYDHVATGHDPDVADPTARIGWRRRDPAPLGKVAARWRDDLIIDQGNHGATYTGGATIMPGLLVVRHFPYRSVEQLVRKVRNGAAAYAAAGDRVDPDHGAHWRQWGALLDEHGPEAIGDVFRKWYWRATPGRSIRIDGERQPALIFDPVAALPTPSA